MAKLITDEDLDLLEELGVDTEPEQADPHSAKEERIIAGFEEIECTIFVGTDSEEVINILGM